MPTIEMGFLPRVAPRLPLRLTNEILHHFQAAPALSAAVDPPRAPPDLTLMDTQMPRQKKGVNVPKSCTTSSLHNIESWGSPGGSSGRDAMHLRWMASQGIGIGWCKISCVNRRKSCVYSPRGVWMLSDVGLILDSPVCCGRVRVYLPGMCGQQYTHVGM